MARASKGIVTILYPAPSAYAAGIRAASAPTLHAAVAPCGAPPCPLRPIVALNNSM